MSILKHSIAALWLLAAVGWSQINTGKITGSCLDSTGAIISGVKILATNEETGVLTRTESFAGGDYLLNFLVPGKYKLEAEREGFQKVVEAGVIVNAGGITRVNFSLRVRTAPR